MKLPQTKNTDIIVQDAGKELLIYDLVTNQAYHLNETSRIVYEACDGKQTFEDLHRRYKLTDNLIYLTLDELQKKDLIEGYYQSPLKGLTRRDALRRASIGVLAALPVIGMIVAPPAASAASASPPSIPPISFPGIPGSCQNPGQPGSFTTAAHTTGGACTNSGYFDLACCSQVSKGTFTLDRPPSGFGTCSNITCT